MSDELDIVAVSSEDREILKLAEPYCDIIERPMEMATDEASSYPAMLHALDQFEDIDYLCLLQPTSPYRVAEDIDACISMLLDTPDCPAIASVSEDNSVPNGAIYVAHTSWLRDGGNFDGPAVMQFYMPPERSLDIDTEADWEEAEEAMESLA